MKTSSQNPSKSQRLNIRIDSDLKTEAQQVYHHLGLDMSTAVTLFLKQSVIDKGLPFRPNFENEDSYTPEEARQIVHSDQLKTYDSLDDLWQDLDHED
ncbi:MAG: type II toxin-antitoxin system RelB/DinJ family antitoxin [Levilactobacillus sp.]|jgi:DNA-damage-inducible protein J|uniref:type II toxin-antitoxin system RelB/DinJ family antitoxin n=1 Tax=Levilactobacillus sp. TaxID=2767919 RepID=UPI00258F73EC|nr:type II toxin-antitoxin system RelB/DinJ family antitoxin [Levilactobacillus sp.]MCI1553010.1 type II toxin-antitoxin system RelB/DinJ family antitoxin [Levilactobacillus sp.]MCI1598151.1 type II toxin-antitoxin system RelB/DinJ family antitoxin [Levilactobacillus sp.]MCI1605014.1 type II toxin-antitoxin system RelB/DinJ family antitoxin [Levilactobacillus sp.]